MSAAGFLPLVSGQGYDLRRVPLLAWADFEAEIRRRLDAGARVAAYFAHRPGPAAAHQLWMLLAEDARGCLWAGRSKVTRAFPSLCARYPQLQLFEREIAEQYGLEPQGHPWLKPVRFQRPMPAPGRKARATAPPAVGSMPFFKVQGEEVHEVAVGPIHAGIIEPGHFRFQCHGEDVFHLEISLGYQHRGIERALLGQPIQGHSAVMETVAGDTSIGHSAAYCQVVEALAGCQKPPRSLTLRGIALELERLANHVGDLGALAGDVGYLPTSAYCGRLRGDFLNLTALLCGSRFGRGFNRPGGVAYDVDDARIATLLRRLDAAEKDVNSAVGLLWDTPSVMARFEGPGALSRATARSLGLVGPVARACGLEQDVRQDHPSGIYRFCHIPVAVGENGDVFARAYVRWLEFHRSLQFIREQCSALPDGPVRCAVKAPKPNRLAVSLLEGWRGEICHVALTDARGRLARYKIVDPSFHNWPGLAMALRGQQISDFPICNKSFNLSYCGHDL
jgi:Ni,Fe-hydrogenase III large subunit